MALHRDVNELMFHLSLGPMFSVAPYPNDGVTPVTVEINHISLADTVQTKLIILFFVVVISLIIFGNNV